MVKNNLTFLSFTRCSKKKAVMIYILLMECNSPRHNIQITFLDFLFYHVNATLDELVERSALELSVLEKGDVEQL